MENLQLIHSKISRDCSLILDAVRRLKDGTWQLGAEDSDWADYLLPRIREALKDHIEFENACVLPEVDPVRAHEHSAHHDHILALLWALDFSKQAKDFEQFHALLDLLYCEVEQHHHEFECQFPLLGKCNDQCIKNKIMKRAENPSLEYR